MKKDNIILHMIKDYGLEVQKLYLELMLSDAEVFVRCQGIFDYTLFDRKLQDAAEFINVYAKEYSVLPDYDMVNANCRTDLVTTRRSQRWSSGLVHG